jgi:hypothetical protein
MLLILLSLKTHLLPIAPAFHHFRSPRDFLSSPRDTAALPFAPPFNNRICTTRRRITVVPQVRLVLPLFNKLFYVRTGLFIIPFPFKIDLILMHSMCLILVLGVSNFNP